MYEDDDLVVAVKETVLSPGQITIFTKQHYTILELVPDVLLSKCAVIANKVGVAVFETLGAHGTNVVIQNGLAGGQKVPHFAIEVMARRENDNLPLLWQPQQLAEDEFDTAFLMLKEEGEKLVITGKKNKVEEAAKPAEKMQVEEGKENYLLKSLRRLP